jgi:hypothetical protein
MQTHEYKVVPAPRRGLKARGLRRPGDRFAHAVESEVNRLAAEGWEFVRSDTLPHEHKAHWWSRPVTVSETLLVFRRPRAEGARTPAMPPPVTLAPSPGSEDSRPVAPAASRFTPPPLAARPANSATPVTPPSPPVLTVVEPSRADTPQDGSNRLAAE